MLAILTTHPIQYQTPIWQALAADGCVPFEVWYLTRHGIGPSLDREFGKTFTWDIDTLSGYPHRFVETMEGASPVSFWKCRLRERLRNRLRNAGAKALWIQGWQVAAYWQAVREAKAMGAEVWLRGESNDLAPVPPWKRALKRALLGWLFGRVDRFLCVGSANKRLYRSFGVTEAKLHPAPYAVDNNRFARQAEAVRGARAQLRRKWGIPDDAFCVMFCGKFISKKRPLDLIQAVRMLRLDKRLPNVHLLFVGSGELSAQMRSSCMIVFDADMRELSTSLSAASATIGPPASFAGFLNQSEISGAYVAADCLVLPSDHNETWGLVVNEALASNLPCLVSKACGCAEDLVGHDRSFPVGDISALADRLVSLHGGRPRGIQRSIPSLAETVSVIKRVYGETPS